MVNGKPALMLHIIIIAVAKAAVLAARFEGNDLLGVIGSSKRHLKSVTCVSAHGLSRPTVFVIILAQIISVRPTEISKVRASTRIFGRPENIIANQAIARNGIQFFASVIIGINQSRKLLVKLPFSR